MQNWKLGLVGIAAAAIAVVALSTSAQNREAASGPAAMQIPQVVFVAPETGSTNLSELAGAGGISYPEN
jgi:hypothetical protein